MLDTVATKVFFFLLFQNVDVLKEAEAVKQLISILKTNVKACKALGHPYVIQVNLSYQLIFYIKTGNQCKVSLLKTGAAGFKIGKINSNSYVY